MKFGFSTSALILSLILSSTAQASLDAQSWSLNKGNKHSSFRIGKSVAAMEADVFSEIVSFQERWKLVSEISEMKSPEKTEVFLKRCLESKKWFLQSAALKELRNRNPDLSLHYAQKLLSSSKALVVRSEAVDILSDLGGPNHTKVLWRALKQQKNFIGTRSLWIRPQIVKTIFKLERSNHARKEWDLLLSDSDTQIKTMAKMVTSTF